MPTFVTCYGPPEAAWWFALSNINTYNMYYKGGVVKLLEVLGILQRTGRGQTMILSRNREVSHRVMQISGGLEC